MIDPLARNRTMPAGVSVAGGTTATVAVIVVGSNSPDGFGVTFSVVVVAARSAGSCIGSIGAAAAARAIAGIGCTRARSAAGLLRAGDDARGFAAIAWRGAGTNAASGLDESRIAAMIRET